MSQESAKKTTDKINLEEIVKLANKIGLEYVAAKKEAEYLELMKSPTKAKIALRLESKEISETKLKRLTEADPEYIEHIIKLTKAKEKAEQLKIRYESYKNLFDARRSMLSYQKEEMKLL